MKCRRPSKLKLTHVKYDFLSLLVKNENIPIYNPSENTGGMMIAGWSLGCGFITGFLANIASFPSADDGDATPSVKQYLRRAIFYGKSFNRFLQ